MNMLKPCYDKNIINLTVSVVSPVPRQNYDVSSNDSSNDVGIATETRHDNDVTSRLQNSDVLGNLHLKLSHLSPLQRNDVKELLREYRRFFLDVPRSETRIFDK